MDTLPAAQRKHGKPFPGDNGPVLPVADPEFHHEAPRLNVPTATAVLIASTALAYITAENLVASLNGMVEHTTVSKEWLTLIVIPIISNAAEHATAVVVARKGKFDLAMSVAVGSCIQIALFVIPLLIMVAWGMGKPLTLLFDPIETMVSILLPHKDVHILTSVSVLVLISPHREVLDRGRQISLDERCCTHWCVSKDLATNKLDSIHRHIHRHRPIFLELSCCGDHSAYRLDLCCVDGRITSMHVYEFTSWK